MCFSNVESDRLTPEKLFALKKSISSPNFKTRDIYLPKKSVPSEPGTTVKCNFSDSKTSPGELRRKASSLSQFLKQFNKDSDFGSVKNDGRFSVASEYSDIQGQIETNESMKQITENSENDQNMSTKNQVAVNSEKENLDSESSSENEFVQFSDVKLDQTNETFEETGQAKGKPQNFLESSEIVESSESSSDRIVDKTVKRKLSVESGARKQLISNLYDRLDFIQRTLSGEGNSDKNSTQKESEVSSVSEVCLENQTQKQG